MEQEIVKKLDEQEKKIDAILESVEKTRKYFLATFIISILMIILPLIGLAIIIPFFINTLSKSLDGLL